MKALVLVGGLGTRLRPLTESRPKQMLPVGGRPMIEGVAAHLAAHGVTEIVLSLGYRPDAFVEAYPDTCAGLPLRFAVEPEPLGTAGAIRFAAIEAGVDDTFVVINGDVLSDLDLTALVADHRGSGAWGTIALQPVDDPSRFGVVVTGPDGLVERFVEKPPAGTEPSNTINAGTYVLEPDVLDLIPAGRSVSIERETFPLLVEQGRLRARVSEVYWIDCGTPAALLQANADALDRSNGSAATVAVAGRIDDGAMVLRSWVAEGAHVAAGARVTGSLIMSGATVANDAEIVDSIVGVGASIGSGCVLAGQTVIGDGVVVEAGSRLTGARVPDGSD